MNKLKQAKDCKCNECGKQAVAFWPNIDPDIPSHPWCRKCLDKVKEDKNRKTLRNELRYNNQKERIFNAYHNMCYFCDKTNNLQIHHRTYNSNDIRDCRVLCKDCHMKLHSELKLKEERILKKIDKCSVSLNDEDEIDVDMETNYRIVYYDKLIEEIKKDE